MYCCHAHVENGEIISISSYNLSTDDEDEDPYPDKDEFTPVEVYYFVTETNGMGNP
jgi:hypothetical protein